MAFNASFYSSRSLQAARLRNTSPLMRSPPVMRTSLPLRTCQEQSTHSPGSPDMSRFLHVSDNDDDRFFRRKPDNSQPVLLGLGIVLPASVSHPGLLREGAIFVNDKDIVARSCVSHCRTRVQAQLERLEIVHETPRKPVLHPVDVQNEISPILPLPPSIDSARSIPGTASTSTSLAESMCEIFPTEKIPRPVIKRLSTAEYVRAKLYTSDPIITEDITSNMMRDGICAKEHRNLTQPSADGTPTVDITEHGLPLDPGTFGMPCLSGSLCENRCGLSHDDDIVKHITNGTHTPISARASPYALHLCSFPIHHNDPRGCDLGTDRKLNPRTSIRHATFRSSIIMGDPAGRTRKRNAVSRQPIEVSSPSMTPSPTSSPQLCILPVGSEHATAPLTRHAPDTQYTPSPRASRHRSQTVTQTIKGRPSDYEIAWTDTTRGVMYMPKTRSPIIIDRSACVSPPVTRGDRLARRNARLIPLAVSKRMSNTVDAV